MSALQPLAGKTRLPIADDSTIEAILSAGGAHVVLLFAGDPAQRPESGDVAVIFPELLKAFEGRLSGAVVAREAEKSLGARFQVDVLPSLAVIRDGATIGVIPRIRDWPEYLEKIEALLAPDAPRAAKAPRVEITFSQKGARA
ncbi:hypothetical protein [Methylocystis parvus]|uniref:Hydrogenase expression/formation protein n=1 Tax=Methylocystis parvus TaxID=134 RepID=A0A6B8LZB6_9HYPH|nr:hypothetical protein [Methylocystis parvus]QGM96804.1 hydrogenase accessory protein [Methylocystis parvus]WBJ99318.1 hydrogenase accessory protein [Methylocystis parvus OBBP]